MSCIIYLRNASLNYFTSTYTMYLQNIFQACRNTKSNRYGSFISFCIHIDSISIIKSSLHNEVSFTVISQSGKAKYMCSNSSFTHFCFHIILDIPTTRSSIYTINQYKCFLHSDLQPYRARYIHKMVLFRVIFEGCQYHISTKMVSLCSFASIYIKHL